MLGAMSAEAAAYGTGDASFRAAGGEPGIRELVATFYRFMDALPEARTIRQMHPDDLEISIDKLARFLCGWLGGPKRYQEKYGSISIPGVHRHLPVTASERDAWLVCMQHGNRRAALCGGFQAVSARAARGARRADPPGLRAGARSLTYPADRRPRGPGGRIGMWKVVQWATGNVGRAALRQIVDHPELELAGVLVHSAEKVGRDAGELIRRAPLGVLATNDVDEILRIPADCVCHTPLPAAQVGDDPERDLRDLCRLLASGRNVVTTVGFMHPRAHGPELSERLAAACREGGSTLHGTGVNPGWLGELLPLTLSALSARIDSVRVVESTEFSGYPSPEIIRGMMGFGTPRDAFARVTERFGRWLRGLFAESVHLIADGLGAVVERIDDEVEPWFADRDLAIAAGPVAKGSLAGHRWSWRGVVDGEARIVLEAIYRAHPLAAPDWPAPGAEVCIEGRPRMVLRLDHDWLGNGLVATAAHAVHAIPHVCAAAPGIATFLDLPLITGRHTLAPKR